MSEWIGTWGASPAAPVHFLPPEVMAAAVPVQGTLRHRLRISAGGSQLRLRLSNELGERPLAIGGASVGLAGRAIAVRPGTLRPVTFGLESAVTLAPGRALESDPVDLALPPLSELIVSVHLSAPHVVTPSEGVHRAWLAPGYDALMQETWTGATAMALRPIFTALCVKPLGPTRVIVALGDSVTDGVGGEEGGARSWAEVLARRLQERAGPTAHGVVNAGIGGNRLLGPLIGPPGLVRLERDVLSTPGVSHLIVLEGINDIGVGGRTFDGVTHPFATPAQLIDAYREIIARAHARGVKVIGGTMLPFRGAFFFTDDKEPVRLAVNDWIRTAGAFDGLIDFDAVVRDTRDPGMLRPEFDTGDHLHPNPAAHRAMGEGIELGLFEGPA